MSLSAYSAVGTSHTPVPSVSLVVKPDQARFSLTVSVETDSAAAAVPLLRRAAQRLEDLLPPLGGKLLVTDFDLTSGNAKVNKPQPQLSATLVLPLAADASVWDRAAKVAQVDDLLRALIDEGKRQKPNLEVRRALPIFVLADPEAHRAKLLETLKARARSIAGDGAAELHELAFERAVTQRALSLEEVEVSLSLEGRLVMKLG
ncbi:MAG: SIMPL domain-containing protein [Myxococcaceae bacterium]